MLLDKLYLLCDFGTCTKLCKCITKYPPPTQRHTEQEIWKKVSCFFSAQNEVVKRHPIHQLPKGGTRNALSTQRNLYCAAQPAAVCGCRRCLSKWRKAVLWIRPASEALPGKAMCDNAKRNKKGVFSWYISWIHPFFMFFSIYLLANFKKSRTFAMWLWNQILS